MLQTWSKYDDATAQCLEEKYNASQTQHRITLSLPSYHGGPMVDRTFTIDFKRMVQYNDNGGTRNIRRAPAQPVNRNRDPSPARAGAVAPHGPLTVGTTPPAQPVNRNRDPVAGAVAPRGSLTVGTTPPVNHNRGPSPARAGALTGPINFYRKDDPYYELTNFYQYPMRDENGFVYPTCEHYFQSHKFLPHAPAVAQKVCDAVGPRGAFDLAHKYTEYERKDWMQGGVRDSVMLDGLRLKFNSPEMRDVLLSTGDRKLVERSPVDNYWGDGGDGTGKNRLGELLMQVRGELRAKVRSPVIPRESDWTPGGPPGSDH